MCQWVTSDDGPICQYRWWQVLHDYYEITIKNCELWMRTCQGNVKNVLDWICDKVSPTTSKPSTLEYVDDIVPVSNQWTQYTRISAIPTRLTSWCSSQSTGSTSAENTRARLGERYRAGRGPSNSLHPVFARTLLVPRFQRFRVAPILSWCRLRREDPQGFQVLLVTYARVRLVVKAHSNELTGRDQ